MIDFDYKSMTLEQLKWAYTSVTFKREPRWHQYVSLAFAEDKPRVCFWHGVGSGKTLCGYYAAQRKKCKNILVVCPKHAISSWIRDIEWTDYSYTLISGETPVRKAKMADGTNVHIIPYHALKTVFCSLKQIPGYDVENTGLTREEAEELLQNNKGYKVEKSSTAPGLWNVLKPKAGKRWTIDKEQIGRYHFDCLILDEVHKCSSPSSTQSKICKEISSRVGNVIALTGTPVDRVLLEMFNIYSVVDLGATFGTNFWFWRLEHFEDAGYDFKIREGHDQIILQQAMRNTLSFSTEECVDLPECIEETLLLESTPEQRKLQGRIILQEPIGVAGCKATFPEGSVMSMKLKQLSGGFLYLPDDKVHVLKNNPKLDAVLSLLEDVGEKVVLWYHFTEVRDIITKALKKQGCNFVGIFGGMSPEEVVESQRRFQNDPSVQIALCQESCNEGWDGFAAGVTVFWDPIISPRRRKQCVGRMHRQGQEKRTVVYNLILEGTVDQFVLGKHETQKNEVDLYMRYMQDYRIRIQGEV